ncbi:MAG TPA: universal stress protein [Gaiellaceae bacterium]|nr:universal stress protein [Gaiellaceae bacterium]
MKGAIICGVDGSDSAKGAARVARSLSAELGLRVVFVHAIDRKAAAADESGVAERLELLGTGVSRPDCGATWCVEVGHPVDALVAAAKKARASLIVVGSTGPRSSLLGSVSADVSRRAPCPVVVVPPRADATVNGRANGASSTAPPEFAGGIARLGVGAGETDYAGGIVRFGLGSDERES